MKRYTFKSENTFWEGVAELDTKQVNWSNKSHVKEVIGWVKEQTKGEVCMNIYADFEFVVKNGYTSVVKDYKINITDRCVSIGICKTKCCIIEDN